MTVVDLRSDTVTLPTQAMRDAARAAPVGDDGRADADGRGEDPSVNRLEDKGAAIMNKEAGLYFPTGTLANFTAALTHCARGDTVAADPDLHVVRSEKAAFMDRFGGLAMARYTRDKDDMPEVASFERACAEPGVRLACLENTHNYAGGTCTSLERMRVLHAAANSRGIPVHLDGARIFNAALALGVPASAIAACADSVQFCLSKGLGAPAGSLLCGSRDFILAARQTRRLLGGVMRQAGVIAAPALLALETGIDRLAEDHENARVLGGGLAGFPGIRLVPVQTNIVMLNVEKSGRAAPWFEERLKPYGVLAKAMGDANLRFTTHKDVDRAGINAAIAAFHAFMRDNGDLLAG